MKIEPGAADTIKAANELGFGEQAIGIHIRSVSFFEKVGKIHPGTFMYS